MTSVSFLDEAEAELWDAVEFYESRCPGLGWDFAKEIRESIHLLQQFPDRWPVREDGTRRYLLHRFPYLVIYLYHEDHLWITAIAHCKRRPGYWSDRTRTAVKTDEAGTG